MSEEIKGNNKINKRKILRRKNRKLSEQNI